MRSRRSSRLSPARALLAALATSVAISACGPLEVDQGAASPPDSPSVPAPVPPLEPPAADAPGSLPLTEAAEATRLALLSAARAGDWDGVARLIPGDGFTASFGADGDPIAYYRDLPEDVLAVIVRLLEGDSGRIGTGMTVWPELHARDPFAIVAEEREALITVYGAEDIRGWEAAGAYLGWRLGIEDDGTWRFLVAGD